MMQEMVVEMDHVLVKIIRNIQDAMSNENMKRAMTRAERTTIFLLSAVSLVLFILILSTVWKSELVKIFMMEDVYEITDVPYIGLLNNQDEYRHPYAACDTGSSVAAVLEYWYPGVNIVSAIHDKYSYCVTHQIKAIEEFVENVVTTDGHKYTATVDSFSIDEIVLYLNKDTQTPLIAFLPTSAEQPSDLRYYPAVVITGINRNTEELTISSYWGGPAQVLTFTEYQALQDALPKENQNTFLVIQPLEFKEYNFNDVDTFNSNPAKVPMLSKAERELFSAMAAAEGAYNLKMFDLAKLNFLRFINNPLFTTSVPPIMQVWELSRFADAVGNGLGEYEEALEILARAKSLNTALDSPFSYFASYEYLLDNNDAGNRDRLSAVYIIEGDMYRKLGNTPKAIESYQEALKIYSGHQGPRDMINDLLLQNTDES